MQCNCILNAITYKNNIYNFLIKRIKTFKKFFFYIIHINLCIKFFEIILKEPKSMFKNNVNIHV